jgi:nickel superoxide dismutase
MKNPINTILQSVLNIEAAEAHCDIPCKIYDPAQAQVAVLSILRFIDLIAEIEAKGQLSIADHAQLSRLVREKEIHAAKVKDEIRGIWGDYFKQPQFEQVEGVHDLVHTIMLKASACKQHISREPAEALLNLVNQFAAAFWLTKGVSTFTATCPYPPSEQVVYPDLK